MIEKCFISKCKRVPIIEMDPQLEKQQVGPHGYCERHDIRNPVRALTAQLDQSKAVIEFIVKQGVVGVEIVEALSGNLRCQEIGDRAGELENLRALADNPEVRADMEQSERSDS